MFGDINIVIIIELSNSLAFFITLFEYLRNLNIHTIQRKSMMQIHTIEKISVKRVQREEISGQKKSCDKCLSDTKRGMTGIMPLCWATRTRTKKNRTRICCVTITP